MSSSLVATLGEQQQRCFGLAAEQGSDTGTVAEVIIRQAQSDDDLSGLPAVQVAAGASFRELGDGPGR